MWRLVHEFLKWAPGALFAGALAVAAIWEEAKDWIAALIVWGWAQMSDPWIAAFGMASVLLYVGAIIWTGRAARMDYDNVREWSVSIDLGCMASSHDDRVMRRYIRDMCRFVNLSTTQARVIDVEMTIPYGDRSKPPLRLWATRRLPIDEPRIGPVLPSRYDPFLTFPIRVEPNTTVEGRIEFDVPQGVVSDDLDLLRAFATIKESRSHRSKRIAEGEVYDAHRQKTYRGRIGSPRPVWGPKLRRWKRRLTGKPIFGTGTVGQMASEAARRMAEIEREVAVEKPPEAPPPENDLTRRAKERASYETRQLTGGFGDPVALGARLLAEDERKKQVDELAQRRRELIAEGRRIVTSHDPSSGEDDRLYLAMQPAFLQFRKHLSERFHQQFSSEAIHVEIEAGRVRVGLLRAFSRELDRLETEWGLDL